MASKPGLGVINASEHLTALGWAGPGHSLDSRTSNRGLAKPLLVTHKTNNRGLGSRSAKERQADQWWLNAFDTALRQINGEEKCNDSGTSALEKVQQYGMGKGSLYGWFRRGEVLGSTFEDLKIDDQSLKKRKATHDMPQEGHMSKRPTSSIEESNIQDAEEDTARSIVKDTAAAIVSLVNRNGKDSSANKAFIKSELRRRRKAGEFDSSRPLDSKAHKQYTKEVKRQTRNEIKRQLDFSATSRAATEREFKSSTTPKKRRRRHDRSK